jgi:sulfate adenylyltransferase subunit 1
MSWFEGPPLLSYLENVAIEKEDQHESSRFRVQYVIRPQTTDLHDYRGYAGKILSGSYRIGEKVIVLPSLQESEIIKIEKHQKEVEIAFAGEPVVLHLKDDLDIGRGDAIVPLHERPHLEQEIETTLCWMDNTEFKPGQRLILQQNSFTSKAAIKELLSKTNINTYEQYQDDGTFKLNDIGRVKIKLAEPLSFDPYHKNRQSGSFILVDANTNNTVAAGVIG